MSGEVAPKPTRFMRASLDPCVVKGSAQAFNFVPAVHPLTHEVALVFEVGAQRLTLIADPDTIDELSLASIRAAAIARYEQAKTKEAARVAAAGQSIVSQH